jgi:hypothetical protein
LQRLAISLATLIAFTSVAGAQADSRDETVRFTPGATSERYRDTISGYDVVNYYLKARAGQSMSVAFSKSKSTCYFNILAPAKGETLYDGSAGPDVYSGTLQESGNYRVVVYLMRVSARRGASCTYSIDFAIWD